MSTQQPALFADEKPARIVEVDILPTHSEMAAVGTTWPLPGNRKLFVFVVRDEENRPKDLVIATTWADTDVLSALNTGVRLPIEWMPLLRMALNEMKP